MNAWPHLLRDAVVSGTTASLLSTVALAICGRIERGSSTAAPAAPAQWVMGEQAAYERRPGPGQLALGYAIHHATATFWAAIHERLFGSHQQPRPVGRRLAQAGATAALACLIDYTVTPHRLRPGFEKHLGKPSLLAVYVAFGIGLTLPALLRKSALRDLRMRRLSVY